MSVAADAGMFLPLEWTPPVGVQAAFTLRGGGVSDGRYATLNLGIHVDDDLSAVAENRRRVCDTLGLRQDARWLSQVHGTRVVKLGRSAAGSVTPPEADASWTTERGVACAILVADCMPVLFASRDGAVVAAAHAGWRGLAAGVLEATVAALPVAPGQLVAWLGPCIGPAGFEVGEDVLRAFTATDGPAAAAFVANARGRWQCDLPALARRRLERLGIGSIHGGGWCTWSDASRFYSHRREAPTGRMAALIWRG